MGSDFGRPRILGHFVKVCMVAKGLRGKKSPPVVPANHGGGSSYARLRLAYVLIFPTGLPCTSALDNFVTDSVRSVDSRDDN
jgi:hypothetical protein